MAQASSYTSSTYHLTIEEYDKLNDKHITNQDINKYLKDDLRIKYYAFILHDNDVNESGNKERKHYHIHINLVRNYAKNTIIKAIASCLLINDDCISVRRVKNDVKSVQYLIHLNDKDKYQYDYLDIWTNDVNELNMNLYMNTSSYEIDIEYLFELCKKSAGVSDVYKELGLEKAKRYRSLIIDMWKEEHVGEY